MTNDFERRKFIVGVAAVGLAGGIELIPGTERAVAQPSADQFQLSNGYLSLVLEGGVVRQLSADPDGRGRFHRRPFLPAGQGLGLGVSAPGFNGVGIAALQPFDVLLNRTSTKAQFRLSEGENVITYTLDGPRLQIEVSPSMATGLAWIYPFTPGGYYDADLHRSYPSPLSSKVFEPDYVPVRSVVGGSGHTHPIEMLKRTASVPTPGEWRVEPLRLGPKGQVLLVGDKDVGCDLDIVVPGSNGVLQHYFDDAAMSHVAVGTGNGPAVLEVAARGDRRAPAESFVPLNLTVSPAPKVLEPLTGKRVDANELLGELLQNGMFHHANWGGGEWLVSLAETHRFNDPRSDYLQRFKQGLAVHSSYLGFDRYGTFGLYFCWLNSPCYADGLLGGVQADMRHVQVSDQFCVAVGNLVLSTGDTSLVLRKRARWVATDAEGPVCGQAASLVDQVLHKGDFPLAGTAPSRHSLGQSFTTTQPFQTVSLRVGNPHASKAAAAVVELFAVGSDKVLARTGTSIPASTQDAQITLQVGSPLPAGQYLARLTNDESGTAWDLGVVGWWTDPASEYAGGEAFTHDFSGSLWDQLKLQFDYTHTRLAADRQGVCGYLEADGYDVTKSGRPDTANNSYWEGLGNGTADMYVSTWHNAAAGVLADLAERLGDTDAAARYRSVRATIDDAFDRTFWHEAVDGDQRWQRYAGWIDWDGKVYDYGYAYCNLEALYRGIPDLNKARSILEWLDFGGLSPDGGQNFGGDIYSLWHSVVPFNTVANDNDVPLGGTLPWRQVITNGGARHYATALDVAGRARVLGPDNAWERTLAVLARFARPDRLTGGRTNSDPGGRGRWHFGDPDSDLADVEGFREIFTMEGRSGVGIVEAFLGLATDGQGLSITPRLPFALNRLQGSGIGFDGQLWTVVAQADRQAVDVHVTSRRGPLIGPDGHEVTVEFQAARSFNRVTIKARVNGRPGSRGGLGLRLLDKAGQVRGETWLAQAVDGQDVSLLVPDSLSAGTWRLVVRAAGASSNRRGLAGGRQPVRLFAETVDIVATPESTTGMQPAGAEAVKATVRSGTALRLPARA